MATTANGSERPGFQLEERIRTLVRDVLQVEVPTFDTDLIDTGLLDSLGLVSLITEIELDLGFELPLDDFDVDRFRSIERIAGYVAEFLSTSDEATGAA